MRVLDLKQSIKILSKKIKFANQVIVNRETDLKKIKISFPWVMKAVSPKIIHKTEFKAVRVGIQNLEQAYLTLKELKKLPGVTGILVQEQVFGFELIIGAKQDIQFGPTVLVGFGGIFTEVLQDFSVRICPLNEQTVTEMLEELKAFPLLSGVRKTQPVNLKMVKQIILSLSQIIETNSNIQEIDLNPVMVNSKKAIAVDARIILER
ncbi:MAG: acetate--CoA ligase family protein [Candidatus Diapherotrites archaeon]|nr:acetate--CoA ligase family protein [Candidatus Diapherotrites archaeon]